MKRIINRNGKEYQYIGPYICPDGYPEQWLYVKIPEKDRKENKGYYIALYIPIKTTHGPRRERE